MIMIEVGALKNTISKLASAACKPIKEYQFFYFFCVFMSVAITIVAKSFSGQFSVFTSFLYALFEIYFACAVAFLFRKIYVDIIVKAIVATFYVIELFVVYIYHSPFSVYVVQLVLETNTQESVEFMRGTLQNTNTWYALLPLSICVFLASAVKYCSKKYIFPSWFSHIVAILIIWSAIRVVSNYHHIFNLFGMDAVAQANVKLPHFTSPFSRGLHGLAMYTQQIDEMVTLEESVNRIYPEGAEGGCPLIVMIVGESYSKHHSQLYTKDCLSTNPMLKSLKDQGNLITYSDAVTAWNLTTNSFKYIFSTWDDMCQDSWTSHTLFTSLFKKSGYQVLFYTNQFVPASQDNFNIMAGSIFNSGNLSEQQFSQRNTMTYAYDGDLLAHVPDIKELTIAPTLLIVHFMGQHMDYAERYPELEMKFSAIDEHKVCGGTKGKEISAHYDNATLYNDKIVGEFLLKFKDTDAIAIYFPDHGEEIYDWRDFYGRSSEDDMSSEVAHYQYEVPLMFYMTDTFMQKHGEVAEQIREASDRPVILTDISNVMLHLGGIKTREYREETDFISDKYKMPRKRMLRDRYDYDELINSIELK